MYIFHIYLIPSQYKTHSKNPQNWLSENMVLVHLTQIESQKGNVLKFTHVRGTLFNAGGQVPFIGTYDQKYPESGGVFLPRELKKHRVGCLRENFKKFPGYFLK